MIDRHIAEARVDARRSMPIVEATGLEGKKIYAERDFAIIDSHDSRGVGERRSSIASERDSRIAHERASAAER